MHRTLYADHHQRHSVSPYLFLRYANPNTRRSRPLISSPASPLMHLAKCLAPAPSRPLEHRSRRLSRLRKASLHLASSHRHPSTAHLPPIGASPWSPCCSPSFNSRFYQLATAARSGWSFLRLSTQVLFSCLLRLAACRCCIFSIVR